MTRLFLLAPLFFLGLTISAAAQTTDKGYVTAKTWIDPATSHAAVGDGKHDDSQNLQDLINYGLGYVVIRSQCPYPARSLLGIASDVNQTYFDRCTFTGFSNCLTDTSIPAL